MLQWQNKIFLLLIVFFTSLTNLLAEDQRFIEFVSNDIESHEVNFEKLRGKVVIVLFWASWCPTCVEEMKYMEAYYQLYKNKGLEIIGFAMDESLEKITTFKKLNAISFPLVFDSEEKAKKYFDVEMLPTMMFVGRDGKIKEIKDPDSGSNETKLTGAKDWGSDRFRKELELILN